MIWHNVILDNTYHTSFLFGIKQEKNLQLLLLYFLFSKTQNNHWINIDVKHLVVRPNQQADTNCEVKILVIKTPRSRLVQTVDWLDTVMFWHSYYITNSLRNYFHFPQSYERIVKTKPVFQALPITFVGLVGFDTLFNLLKMKLNHSLLLFLYCKKKYFQKHNTITESRLRKIT